MSTGWFESNLCPTRNRPDDIGFPVERPVIDHENPLVELDWTWLDDSSIGWSWWRHWQKLFLLKIYIFFAGFELKTSNLHLDLSKNVLILAETTKYSPIQAKSTRLYPNLTKNQETFTRFEQKQSHFRQQPLSSVRTVLVCVAPSQTGSLGPS